MVEPQRFATAELQAFILDAYTPVRAKLTKKLQAAPGPLPTIGAYGTVAVFEDLYGNDRDLLEPKRCPM